MRPFLSIVIPAWNEELRLPATLRQLAAFCKTAPYACEVIVVVEPGQDDTLQAALDFAADQSIKLSVINCRVHRGKGYAVRTGMLRARGELIFYMDADLSVPLREIGAFVDFFAEHPEVGLLMGNRAHAQSRITRRQSLLRRSMGQLFNRILRSQGLGDLRDTQCGFKAFRLAAARAIFKRQSLDGFAFDVEVLLLAEQLEIAIADMPVEWINSPESKVHIVRDSLRMLWDGVSVMRRESRQGRGK
jgi:glycosyltransferase involved in cell wall biosynthesis